MILTIPAAIALFIILAICLIWPNNQLFKDCMGVQIIIVLCCVSFDLIRMIFS